MRIASLLPSATEIVCALGLEDDLVGITHECDHPPSVKRKPVLTSSVLSGPHDSAEIDRHIRRLVHQGSSIYRLDADLLHSLEPDLILTQELCDVCAVSYPVVERAARRLDGPAQLVSLEPDSLDDVYETIRIVGRLTGRVDRAEQVVSGLQARTRKVGERVNGQRRRTTQCLEWVDPPYNCGHWTPGLIRLAGGDDMLGTPGRPARPLNRDEVAAARAEVVVVMACGFTLDRSLQEVQRADPTLVSGGAEVWVVDGNAYFSRPGPRLVDSVEIMAGILHPDRVEPPSATIASRLR